MRTNKYPDANGDTFTFDGTVCSNPERRGGRPCLAGHRITIAQVIQEVAKEGSEAFASNFDLDPNLVNRFLWALSRSFEEPQP